MVISHAGFMKQRFGFCLQIFSRWARCQYERGYSMSSCVDEMLKSYADNRECEFWKTIWIYRNQIQRLYWSILMLNQNEKQTEQNQWVGLKSTKSPRLTEDQKVNRKDGSKEKIRWRVNKKIKKLLTMSCASLMCMPDKLVNRSILPEYSEMAT